MFLVSSIITSLIFCLLFIFKVKQKFNIHIAFFTMILVLHMILAIGYQLSYLHPWSQYVLCIIVMLSLVWITRHHLFTTQGRMFLGDVLSFTLVISSLCIGAFCVATLLPSWWSLPFSLLGQLSMVFLMTWPFYLYFTHLISKRPPSDATHQLIILGAGIFTEEVTPMLKSRLDAALHLQTLHSNTFQFIVSGGQGPDEPISEALAMQRYLISRGVPSSHIIMEDQSTNTVENLVYSKKHFKNPRGICVTSEFHVLRALKIAQRQGLTLVGFGAPSPLHLRARALIKDYCGLLLHHSRTWWIFSLIVVYVKAYLILS